MTATYVSRTQETATITTFTFLIAEQLSFIAGQFLEMAIEHARPDDRGTRRWFTISSSPETLPYLTITVRIPEQPSSFKRALLALTPGSTVTIRDVMGDFVLPKNTSKPLAFITYGIGITPVGSMLRYLTDRSETRDLAIIYAGREQTDFLWQNLLPQRTQYIEAKPEEITYAHARMLIPDLENRTVYVSGAERFVEVLLTEARKQNHPEHKLVGDYFHNY